jgi:hypothetical protein
VRGGRTRGRRRYAGGVTEARAQHHREAARRHRDAAEFHDASAARWIEAGDEERAELARRGAVLERGLAELEEDIAAMEARTE